MGVDAYNIKTRCVGAVSKLLESYLNKITVKLLADKVLKLAFARQK